MTQRYLITITRAGGLTQDHVDSLKHYFASRFTSVVVNVEAHKSGLWHMHAYAETKVTRSAVRTHLSRHLLTIGVDSGAKALNVKCADVGARQYVVKEVTEDKPVTMCQGWSIEQLLAERREALKKLSRKEIMGTYKVVTQDEAVPLMLKFAKSHSIAVTDKTSFIQLGKAMMKAKFSFSRVKVQSLYAEVMIQLGDEHPAEDWWENALIGMR